MRPEDPYLSYHDVLLTKEDVDTLRDDWLTDNVISFYEEYLEHETLTNYDSAKVVLLRPSMTLMLFMTKDPETLKEALPSFKGVTHIFLPINDNTDPEKAEGGSHWSLLVVSTSDKKAFHYDSLASANEKESRIVASKMGRLLGYELTYVDLEETPQQTNSSDCGVFVCMIMENLLVTKLLTKRVGEQINVSLGNVHLDARRTRLNILKIINDRRRQAQRRRSASGSPMSASNSLSPPRIE